MTDPTRPVRDQAITAACEAAGWDWPEVPEEHIPSAEDCMADIVDAVLAVVTDRKTAAQMSRAEALASERNKYPTRGGL